MSTSIEGLLDDYREHIKRLEEVRKWHPCAERRCDSDGASWLVAQNLTVADCDSLIYTEAGFLPAKQVANFDIVPDGVFPISEAAMTIRLNRSRSKVRSVIAALWPER